MKDPILLPGEEVIRLLQAYLNETKKRIDILVLGLQRIARLRPVYNYPGWIAEDTLKEAKV